MIATRVPLALLAFAVICVNALAAESEPPPGAAQCTGCHAASAKVDSAIPRLAGRTAADIVAQMQAFKSGEKPSTVMGRLAKGFSETEVQAIAEWYAQQKER